MSKYVIDASVILYYLLSEDNKVEKEVKKLLIKARDNKAKLYSSELLKFEVGNGLRYCLKDPVLLGKTYKLFLRLPLEYKQVTNTVYIKTLSAAIKYNTSFYDVSYHLLAKALQAQFLTCDKNYYNKAKDFGSIKLL